MRHEYGLFKRKRKAGSSWYFWFYDQNGIRQHKSTGRKKKYEAEQYAQQFLVLSKSPKPIRLDEYAKDFYVWGKCDWIKRKFARGFAIGSTFAATRRAHLVNHILPEFGTVEISKIEPIQIEKWLLNLDLSNTTKNHILGSFRIILHEALREHLINHNPAKDVELLSRSDYKRRDTLTLQEIKILFPEDEKEMLRIWRRYDYSVLFFLLLTSGIRSGEARALQWQHIIWPENGILIVQAAKADKSIGPPKSGKVRGVIVPERTMQLLQWWHSLTVCKEQNDYVFIGQDLKKPINKDGISKEFPKALKRAGIDIGGRNLVAHSLRHTYNTIMKGILTAEMLREFTGHRSEEMTDRYDNPYLIDRLQQFSSSR